MRGRGDFVECPCRRTLDDWIWEKPRANMRAKPKEPKGFGRADDSLF